MRSAPRPRSVISTLRARCHFYLAPTLLSMLVIATSQMLITPSCLLSALHRWQEQAASGWVQ